MQACGSYMPIPILATISGVLTRRLFNGPRLHSLAQTRTRRTVTESDTDNASDRESSDSSSESSDGRARARHTTMPAAGNIRRGCGQIRGRGRNGDSLGPTASGSGSATPLCLP